MSKTMIPQNYTPALNLYDTQRAIGTVKRLFADTLCATLNLYRVSAPLFLEASTGLNDDLNGVERKVTFDIRDSGIEAQVVQSLAKWKRKALKDYGFRVGKGLYCDMNAIRRDEELDNLHSVYVDQWDWEKVIREEDRSEAYLKNVVRSIVSAVCATEMNLHAMFPQLQDLPLHTPNVTFITTQELEDKYPDLTPKERENAFVKENGTTFEEALADIEALFGLKAEGEEGDKLVLTAYELEQLRVAFEKSINGTETGEDAQAEYVMYGTYDPLSVTLTHILNNKSGISFTSYSHTGLPVAVLAEGVNAEVFNGYYDNTEIFNKLAEMLNVQ